MVDGQDSLVHPDGGAELNGPPNVYRMERWRAKPFERYPANGDKFLAIIPDQNHGQMGDGGSAAVKAYEAEHFPS